MNFIGSHSEAIVLILAYMFLALVSALPTPGDPRPISQKIYETIYTALHLLANRVIDKKPALAPPQEAKQ